MLRSALASAVLALLVAGGSAQAQPSQTIAPGGRRAEARAAARTGVASYYAASLHGRRTANGERYDRRALTAAHRSLPFGTLLRVTAPRTGRRVLVRVNDRGPFVRGRQLDVSGAAADRLAMRRRGDGPGDVPGRRPGLAPEPPGPAAAQGPPHLRDWGLGSGKVTDRAGGESGLL